VILKFFSALVVAFLCALSLSPELGAATATPTFSASPTVTLTPTPGEGSAGVNPSTLVSGSNFNSLVVNFTAGSTAYAASGGLVTLYFPIGLGTPNSSNFYVPPSEAIYVPTSNYSFSGQTVTVKVLNLPAGGNLDFQYGFNASGFHVSSTHANETINIWTYPQSISLGAGGLAAQPLITILTATITPTISPTFTPSPTPTQTESFTSSPTFTQTPNWTATATPTFTAIAAQEDNRVYSYPNPFDLRQFNKVTFRFPNAASAKVMVYTLSGQPVREIPLQDMDSTLGWAIWRGDNDHGRLVSGGIYYVRVKTSKTFVSKFTVIH
jgi:hypothetical protein